MTVGDLIKWFAMCLGAYLVLFAVQIPLPRKTRLALRITLCVVKAVMTVAIAYVIMTVPCWFSSRGVYPSTAVYAALMADVASDIIMIPVSAIRNRGGKDKPYLLVNFLVSLLVTVAVVLYGTLNMQTIRANRLTYTSAKLSREHRFVFVSDIHMGAAQSRKTIAEALERIKAEKPDFIVLGGDITDEFTQKNEMQDIMSMFGSLGIPVYYIYGNHDRQAGSARAGGPTYSPGELEKAIADAGLTILDDSIVAISGDLVMLGREAYNHDSRMYPGDLPETKDGPFILCIDHSPFEKNDIVATGADLQVSGHSHAGQFFPLQFIYNIAGYDAYGWYKVGDTDVFVSSGFSGWGVPFRTEGQSEYVVMDLLPAR